MNTMIQIKTKSVIDNASASVNIEKKLGYQEKTVDVLDQESFIEHLRREKNRSQRSGVALSILLIKLHNADTPNIITVSDIFKGIRAKIRETDTIGYVDKNTLGVLLPYTDEKGAKSSADKINSSFIDPRFSVSASTYPDEIFESLTKNGFIAPDVTNLMLKDTVEHSWFMLKVKRVIDIVGAIVALILFSPVMLAVALCVKFSSPGPVIFKQIRLGAKGVPFTFYKFRSMYANNNNQIHKDYVLKLIDGDSSSNQGDADKPMFKMKADPRITKVGGFIRKTSLDELPQFYNVIKGDMSLVGPRPPLAYEAERYKPWHLRRILEMKPGITGLWQVEGRGRKDFDHSVRLDVRYLKSWSIWLDIKILFRTVKEVLECRGAV